MKTTPIMKTNPSAPPAADLPRLVEAERRLDERLAAARAEATRIVAAAREAARGREAGLQAELDEIERGLREAADAEGASRARAIEDAAQREVAAYDRVDASRITQLARHVVAQVVGERGA